MTVAGLSLAELLAPISEEAPTGNDIRSDFSPSSVYFRLRDARADARAAERAADANPEEVVPIEKWRLVQSLSKEIIETKSKDIEVAVWMTEALVRSHGLAGLAFGAQLLGGLAERYWPTLFPLPDEDGTESRITPISGLSGTGRHGTLSQPLQKLSLFRGAGGEGVMFFQYQQSSELAMIADPRRIEARISSGIIPYDSMQALAYAAPAEDFIKLRQDLDDARKAWHDMDKVYHRLAGSNAPSTREVSDVLDQIGAVVSRYEPQKVDAFSVLAATPQSDTTTTAPIENQESSHTSPRGREEALSALSEIANYFRKTEPQSPLAYTIDEAVRRGRLTLPELLDELVWDAQLRNNIFISLGLKVEREP